MKTKREDFYWPTLCTLIIVCIMLVLSAAGCATQGTSGKEMMLSYSHALSNCKGEVGCLASLQGAFYSGAFRDQQQDSIGSVAIAMLPWGRLILEGLALYKSGSGNGGNGILVKGNNNQFIGFNKLIADKGASIYSPFDTTASPAMTQSWADMNNQDNIRSQNQ